MASAEGKDPDRLLTTIRLSFLPGVTVLGGFRSGSEIFPSLKVKPTVSWGDIVAYYITMQPTYKSHLLSFDFYVKQNEFGGLWKLSEHLNDLVGPKNMTLYQSSDALTHAIAQAFKQFKPNH